MKLLLYTSFCPPKSKRSVLSSRRKVHKVSSSPSRPDGLTCSGNQRVLTSFQRLWNPLGPDQLWATSRTTRAKAAPDATGFQSEWYERLKVEYVSKSITHRQMRSQKTHTITGNALCLCDSVIQMISKKKPIFLRNKYASVQEHKKVKLSNYRPGHAPTCPEGWGPQNFQTTGTQSVPRTGRLNPSKIPGSYICYRLSRTQDHNVVGRIKSMNNLNNPTRNRTRDISACNAVPQQTTYPSSETRQNC